MLRSKSSSPPHAWQSGTASWVGVCSGAVLVGQLLGEAFAGLLRQAEPGRAATEGYMYGRIVYAEGTPGSSDVGDYAARSRSRRVSCPIKWRHATSTRRAIRNTFYRVGLHTKPKRIVHILAQQGVRVSEELVRQVRFEMLNETAGKRFAGVSRPVPSPAVRRRPQGFPGRDQG
jgi:hypothetical protein